MEIKEILQSLCSGAGVAGGEYRLFDKVKDLLSPFSNVTCDHMGNVLAQVGQTDASEHILLDAHLDEIGFVVTSVEKDGFLKVAGVGGVDVRTLLGCEVTIWGKEPLYGVFATMPPHLQGEGDREKYPALDTLCIDTGLSGERAAALISLGDTVSLRTDVVSLLGTRLTGKGFDNKAGCACLIYSAYLISLDKPNCNVTVLLSAQEEVGGRGAKPAAYRISPTKAIAVDVSFGYTPDCPRHKCGVMSEGAMIGFAPTLDRQMSEQLCEIAKRDELPFQREIMGGTTSTNADVISLTKSGIPTALLSIPLMNMHTAVEVVDTEDILCAAKLIAAYIKEVAKC